MPPTPPRNVAAKDYRVAGHEKFHSQPVVPTVQDLLAVLPNLEGTLGNGALQLVDNPYHTAEDDALVWRVVHAAECLHCLGRRGNRLMVSSQLVEEKALHGTAKTTTGRLGILTRGGQFSTEIAVNLTRMEPDELRVQGAPDDARRAAGTIHKDGFAGDERHFYHAPFFFGLRTGTAFCYTSTGKLCATLDTQSGAKLIKGTRLAMVHTYHTLSLGTEADIADVRPIATVVFTARQRQADDPPAPVQALQRTAALPPVPPTYEPCSQGVTIDRLHGAKQAAATARAASCPGCSFVRGISMWLEGGQTKDAHDAATAAVVQRGKQPCFHGCALLHDEEATQDQTATLNKSIFAAANYASINLYNLLRPRARPELLRAVGCIYDTRGVSSSLEVDAEVLKRQVSRIPQRMEAVLDMASTAAQAADAAWEERRRHEEAAAAVAAEKAAAKEVKKRVPTLRFMNAAGQEECRGQLGTKVQKNGKASYQLILCDMQARQRWLSKEACDAAA
ncbi:hypothetical protein C2E20_8997 [Micractinium conductrix]|uniref:Uncharacterized protein n=1 Tax=Micractinium conductrix TaxID=554055 RepID=A0A2P6UZR8_9CHLO|nr:hypothetical protein C2E20_8997 [Micractinium conductrix]|eukprot:PSC67332.1 hypothetical protein C2E20_8997 [Micractinium conductrix]